MINISDFPFEKIQKKKNHPKILMCISLNIKYLVYNVKLLCVLFFKKINRFIEDYKGRHYLKFRLKEKIRMC